MKTPDTGPRCRTCGAMVEFQNGMAYAVMTGRPHDCETERVQPRSLTSLLRDAFQPCNGCQAHVAALGASRTVYELKAHVCQGPQPRRQTGFVPSPNRPRWERS